MKIHGFILTTIMGITTVSCTQENFGVKELESVARQVTDDVTCKSSGLEQNLFDGLKDYLIERSEMPSAQDLKKALAANFSERQDLRSGQNARISQKVQSDLDGLIDILLQEAPEGERVTTPEELLILISAIDVGDRSTPFRSYLQDKVQGRLGRLKTAVNTLSVDCNAPEIPQDEVGTPPTPPVDVVETPVEEIGDDKANRDYTYHRSQALANGEGLAVFGARWTLATAYQSCMSVQIPDMTAQTPDLKGISIVGNHSDGVGKKRSIASLASVQGSHPYIKGVTRHDNGCFNVRSNPLIYDYGGKPTATTAANAKINMHKNGGSGTSVLGIDCSAYVYTSMATAGLRLKEGRALKASDSWAWGSGSYVEPEKNGLTCLSKVTVTPSQSLKAGDIIAVYGHVVLVEKTGRDPFGLSRAKTVSDCSKLTASGYDFTVAQSSPSKGGVGINFFEAKAYVPTSSKFAEGLKQYAYYSCLAKFNNKNYTPNLGTLTVSRHKGTAACMSTRVSLENESCVQSCSSYMR